MSVVFENNVAYLGESGAAVFFSKNSMSAFSSVSSGKKRKQKATNVGLPQWQTDLNVAPWGEDNIFPQRIVSQLDYCGVAKEVLDWKAKALYGNGLFWGHVIGYKDDGSEIFQIAQPGEQPEVESFMRENGNLARYFMEFNQDWYYFANCFPELVLNNKGDKVVKLIHQESCDCRFKQADNEGNINTVYLSKVWDDPNDQLVKYEKKPGYTTKENFPAGGPKELNKFVARRDAVDIYDSLNSLAYFAKKGKRNIICPVNYPSPNKTYYQLAVWDGARLSGWLEIAAKIPTMLKSLYEKAFNLQYHIEIPANYFLKKYGEEKWLQMTKDEQKKARIEVLQEMDRFLSGAENAHKAFVSYFEIDKMTGHEVGRIKITVLDNKTNLDKEQLASSMANSEICFANGVNPDLIGAGAPGGPYSGSAGSGSNIREAYLTYTASLKLEREVILEPLKLIQQFNGWDKDLQFRFRDVVLTTLDQGKGTEKKLS